MSKDRDGCGGAFQCGESQHQQRQNCRIRKGLEELGHISSREGTEMDGFARNISRVRRAQQKNGLKDLIFQFSPGLFLFHGIRYPHQ